MTTDKTVDLIWLLLNHSATLNLFLSMDFDGGVTQFVDRKSMM